MITINNVTLFGRLTHDPQIKYTAKGLAMLGIRVAVNRRTKGEADFINCQAFEKTAETIATYLHKGSQICLRGHIQTGSYKNKEGQNVYTTDVIIDEFDFVSDGQPRQNNGNNSYQPQPQAQNPYDDVPPGFTEMSEGIPF